MEKLSIVIPYHNRIKSASYFNKSIENLDRNKFEIIISAYYFDYSTIFFKNMNIINNNTHFEIGKYKNKGIDSSKNNWILIQDIDCIGTIELYEYIYNKIQTMNENDFMILGAEYTKKDGSINQKFIKCGNEIVFYKNIWEKIDKIPEWEEWGFEDYAFEYKLMKNKNLDFKLSHIDLIDISQTIRDELTIPENKKHPFYFKHLYHEKNIDNEKVKINRQKLLDLVRSYE